MKKLKMNLQETIFFSYDTKHTKKEVREIMKEEFSNIMNDLMLRVGERLDEEEEAWIGKE